MIIYSHRVTQWAQHVGISLPDLAAALAAWNARAAWVFGSTVRGDDVAGSDIDIAVITAPYGSGPSHPPMAFVVQARLPVEWHVWAQMSPPLQAEAVASGICVFEATSGEADRIAREVHKAWQRDAPARAARRAAELADAQPLT